MLCESTSTLTSFAGETNPIEGYLDLPLFIGNTNVQHRFYVMKPGKVLTPVILGQPWQQTYNGVPNWRREGVNFEYDNARLFTPFLNDEDFTTNSDFKSVGDAKEEKETVVETPTTKEKSQEETLATQDNTIEMAQDKAILERVPTNNHFTKRHTTLWIPKKLARAQQVFLQIWVPKKANRKI